MRKKAHSVTMLSSSKDIEIPPDRPRENVDVSFNEWR